jgi:hypothetical protein
MTIHDAPAWPWQGLWLAVLHGVGIATRDDLAELERGVDALAARLEAPRPRRRAERKTPPRTAARRPSATRRRAHG